jgi:exonuclease III
MAYFLGAGNKLRKVALLSRFPICRPKSYHPLFPIWRNWEARHIIKHIRDYGNEPCLVAGDFNAIAPADNITIDSMPKWLKKCLELIIFSQGNVVYRFSLQALLSSGLTDCFRSVNSTTAGFTLPPPNPGMRLDYILANERATLHLKNCWVVREPAAVDQASDHYPVMAEFTFTS